MRESELFSAYRHSAGYSAQCACGTWIDARTQSEVAHVVSIHNLSPEHKQWRLEQDAVEALRRQPVHVCPCKGVE